MREALYPDTWDDEDFSYERVSRLLRFVAGETAATLPGGQGFEQFSTRVEPHSPGLRSRMWYGGGVAGVGAVGGRERGQLPDLVGGEGGGVGRTSRRSSCPTIRTFRDAHPAGAAARVSQGLVVIPTDSASPCAAGEVRGLRSRADAAHRRPDRAGPADVRPGHPRPLGADRRGAVRAPAFREVTEVAFALPFAFEPEDYARSSPTWPPGSGPRSAGPPRAILPALASGR